MPKPASAHTGLPGLGMMHPEYVRTQNVWTRCRDAYDGSDAIKSRLLWNSAGRPGSLGGRYLPVPEAMDVSTELGQRRYRAYVERALWYGATTRTVDAFAGAVFQKPPEWLKVSKTVEGHLEDVTMTGVPADLFWLLACREVLIQGRGGVLVDMSLEGGQPYWTPYQAENILNWNVERVNGRPTLVDVLLQEVKTDSSADPLTVDPAEVVVYYRHLALRDGVYRQDLYREDAEEPHTSKRLVKVSSETPLRRGKPLPFIPWTWLGSTTLEAEVQRPPLVDLVDVNISHFRTSADLEHGLHYVGTPQLVLIGGLNNSGEPVKFGSGRALLLPRDSDAKILQADGNLMGALENAEERKRKLMAVLGARLLDAAPQVERDTATAVIARSSGEHANLRTIACALEMAATRVLKIHEWWTGTTAQPDDLEAAAELNKDYLATRMTPEELKNWVLALQAEAVSHETFWHALVRGGVARPGVSSEEELEQIEEEKPEEVDMPMAGGESPSASGAGGYKLVNKDGSWMVVDAKGQTVPGGNYGNDQAAAKRHHAKLAGGQSAPSQPKPEGA